MKFSGMDWILLWHIFRPTIFEIYIALIVPTMFLCSRRLISRRPTLAGLILSAASFVVVMWFPIGAILWLIIGGLAFGERGRYSLLNGLPFATLMALCGTCADALIARFIFRERVGKKEFALLYAGNLLATALTIAILLILVSIYPPQVIA
jgi:hypothetical protein